MADWEEFGDIPPCINGNCRVGALLARDPEITEIIDTYLMAKEVPLYKDNAFLAYKLLSKSGLLNHPHLLLLLEHELYIYRAKMSESTHLEGLARARLAARRMEAGH